MQITVFIEKIQMLELESLIKTRAVANKYIIENQDGVIKALKSGWGFWFILIFLRTSFAKIRLKLKVIKNINVLIEGKIDIKILTTSSIFFFGFTLYASKISITILLKKIFISFSSIFFKKIR